MSGECCPCCGEAYYQVSACNVKWLDRPCRNKITWSACQNAERLAIERAAEIETLKKNLADAQGDCEQEAMENRQLAAELDAIKTALGCQGMNLADVLKVVEVLKGETVQEAMEKKPVRCDHCNGMGGRMTWDGVNDPESEPCVICNGTGYMQ